MRAQDSYQPKGASDNSADYERIFIRRAHRLLGLGYLRLDHRKFADSDEEDITGVLCEVMDDVIKDKTSPREITKWLSVHENPPERDPIRKGKHRRKLDICFEGIGHQPRPKLRFEAKRLGPKHGVGIYLGNDGLGRFVERGYAKDARYAGMIGYVQAGKPEEWGASIEAEISRKSDLKPIGSSPWRKEEIVKELSYTYRSGHNRPNGTSIEIYHCLLLFN